MLHFYFFSLISDGSWLQINLQINEESRLKEDRTRTQCLLCTAKKPHCLFLAITMVNVAIYIHMKMLYADIIIVFFFVFLEKRTPVWMRIHCFCCPQKQVSPPAVESRFSTYDCTVPVVLVTDVHYYDTLSQEPKLTGSNNMQTIDL